MPGQASGWWVVLAEGHSKAVGVGVHTLAQQQRGQVAHNVVYVRRYMQGTAKQVAEKDPVVGWHISPDDDLRPLL